MNWFVLAAGLLYLGAAFVYVVEHKYLLAVAFVCYAIANFCFAKL